MNATREDVVIDAKTATIRPAIADGDDYFGLSSGSNGTAAAARRAAVASPGLSWLRHNGDPAKGLNYKPGDGSGHTFTNPWSGMP